MDSIASQFWIGLKDVDVPALNLEIEVVKEFPDNIYKKAEELDCWAFISGRKDPTVVGFNLGRITLRVIKAFATVNGVGTIQEMLVHDGVRACRFYPVHAASRQAFSLRVLYGEFPHQMYDARALQDVIDQ